MTNNNSPPTKTPKTKNPDDCFLGVFFFLQRKYISLFRQYISKRFFIQPNVTKTANFPLFGNI